MKGFITLILFALVIHNVGLAAKIKITKTIDLQEAQGSNVGFYTGGSYQKTGMFSYKMLFYSLSMY